MAPPRGSQNPGTYNLCSNWDFNAPGAIFEVKTGRSIYDAFESDIARPIGMQDFHRSVHKRQGDSTRSIHPAYHFVLSTRDAAGMVGEYEMAPGRSLRITLEDGHLRSEPTGSAKQPLRQRAHAAGA